MRLALLRELSLSTRAPEAILMCGFPAIGFALALAGTPSVSVPRLAMFLLATSLLSLGVYVFNGWCGVGHDLSNPRFRSNSITNGAVPLAGALAFSLVTSTLSVAVFTVVEPTAAGLALVIFCLFAAYSHPGLRLKQGGVAPTLIHLAGGFLMIWLGYAMVRPLDEAGAVPAAFFSLVFTAGHFNHEALDMEADQCAGLRTRAVRWGARASLAAGAAASALAYLGLLAALLLSWPEVRHMAPFLVIAPLHGAAFTLALRSPTHEAIRRYRQAYRQLFLAAGIAYVFLIWLLHGR
ncbi:MAG: UbiA family prenyltransferase [Acidobacteria bacterium]|jgi:4-hydroxybenzoate polyprenyltransferase|nr:UbiA family prenyltransferase [Acidobacteriota bacterium]